MKAYLISLPERVVRSVSALAGGLVREIGNVTVPPAVRRTSLYRNMVEATLRYLIEEVGEVEGVYPKEGELARDFLLRRAAGHGVGMVAMLAFRASPVWVTAALADLSGTGRHLIREIAETLRNEGLLEGGNQFESVDQLLDGMERCSEQMTQVFAAPPLRIAELRMEWHAFRDEVKKMPHPHLPSVTLLEDFWNRLRAEAETQEKPILVLASGMAVAAISRAPENLLWLGSASALSVHRTGELLAGALLSHYFETLREIRETGFATWWAGEFRPYLRAAAGQFSREHPSSTEGIIARLSKAPPHGMGP